MSSLPIGVEDFKEIREKNYFYIDKTDMINDVIQEKVVLYTRPRRFGKTLNMSMLKYFFSIKENSKELFEGLNISNNAEAMKHMNQYPVISISLKDMEGDSIASCIEWLKGELPYVINPYIEDIRNSKIDKSYVEVIERIFNRKASVDELKDSLKLISFCLEACYGRKVIILVDEYDVPLQRAYVEGYYDDMVKFLRRFLSSALKTNTSLEKGVLTGCLRIAKESIFTGLNNLNVYSILDKATSSCFGFTQQDVSELLESYEMKSQMDRVKEWYDGYLFGNTEIYNPWSTLKYIQKVIQGQEEATSFWANSSGNDIVYRYINESNPEMKKDFDLLIHGNSIEKEIKPELTYREMDDINNIYSFLLFTGYLKIKENLGNNVYTLEIPNKEIRYIYEKIFSEWFQQKEKESSVSFVQSLVSEDLRGANHILNEILLNSISYYDSVEAFYHGFIVGMLSQNQAFRVKSNRESGDGRYDIALLSKDYEMAIVIECKEVKEDISLKRVSQEAIQQIKEQRYMEELKEDYVKVLGYGIAFYKKNCFISKL